MKKENTKVSANLEFKIFFCKDRYRTMQHLVVWIKEMKVSYGTKS